MPDKMVLLHGGLVQCEKQTPELLAVIISLLLHMPKTKSLKEGSRAEREKGPKSLKRLNGCSSPILKASGQIRKAQDQNNKEWVYDPTSGGR